MDLLNFGVVNTLVKSVFLYDVTFPRYTAESKTVMAKIYTIKTNKNTHSESLKSILFGLYIWA